MAITSPHASRKCLRCQSALPEGANFCVACGFNNEAAVYDKSVGAAYEAQRRLDWMKFWQSLGSFRWLSWWR